MALPSVPNVIKARVEGTVNSLPWNNIWYFAFTETGSGAPGPADLNAVAQNLYHAYDTALRPQWDAVTTLEAVETTDLTTSSSATGAYVAHGHGPVTGTTVDAAASVLCKQIIPRRYRGGHPRKYLPPLNGSDLVDDDEWNHTTIDALATSFGTAIQNISAAPTVPYTLISVSGPVNVSFYAGFTNYTRSSGRADSKPTQRGTPLVDNVLGIELEYALATQRRRLGR